MLVRKFRWGIFGTGGISAKFVAGLANAREAEATFVASRTLARAQAFASGMKISNAIEGYTKAVRHGGVDAIYIATPPSEHCWQALLCIEAGIPVLVEKPFATNLAEASKIAEASRAHSVFTMEGMWTRFLPATQALKDALRTGEIGEVRLISGNFGTSQALDRSNGMLNPALGGGALTHLGAYPLSLGQFLFGSASPVHAVASIGPTGVDEDVAFQLRYKEGLIGSFFVSLRAWAPDDLWVMGTHGMIGFCGSIVRPTGLNVSKEAPIIAALPRFGFRERLRQNSTVHKAAQMLRKSSRSRGSRRDYYYKGNGYHYEADEVRACVERGALESSVMPLKDSIEVASIAGCISDSMRIDIVKRGSD